jgi:hypothetical protein
MKPGDVRDERLRDDPALSGELRRAFAGYRELVPGQDAQDAMFAGVERALRKAPAGQAAGGTLRRYLAGLTLLAAIGLGLWSVRNGESHRAPSGQTPAARTPVQRVENAVPVRPTDKVAPEAQLPATRSSHPPSRAKRVAKPAAKAGASDPARELALLTRAKRLLASDPAHALALAEQHAQLYPRGAFAEEREVIAIEALMRAEAREAARARAQAFRASYPRSTHLDRVRVVLLEP